MLFLANFQMVFEMYGFLFATVCLLKSRESLVMQPVNYKMDYRRLMKHVERYEVCRRFEREKTRNEILILACL